MANNQLLPFERNRYYVGKLLTSADFQAEQTYVNNKRRFLNEMMFGDGIVCGLGVFSLDDLSIMVDSGVAVDGSGREIALDNPVVHKLSTIEGFEELESSRAVLCLKYNEEDVHPVYTVKGQENGESYECNRIREGWQLYLADAETMPAEFPIEPEFLAIASLYADDDYTVTCSFPAQVPCGAEVRLDITIAKLNADAQPLTLKTKLQMPAFVDSNGAHELEIDLPEICPDGEVTLHRFVKSQDMPANESALLADEIDIKVKVGDQDRPAKENFSLRTAVVEATAEQIVDQAVASTNLEMRTLGGGQEYVVLAEISLQRTRNAYLIEGIKTAGVRKYIHTIADSGLRESLSGWFNADKTAQAGKTADQPAAGSNEKYLEPIYATGICEIPLEANMRRGQIAYSDEIIHGLGPGTVYVSVGVEYLANDIKIGSTARNTIYGNASLFAQEQLPTVEAETAVKVMNDRGSFVVAAKLLEDSNQVVLTMRWVAVMLPVGKQESRIEKLAGKSISPVQPTVVLGLRETHFFNARFNNMEPCTLTYELTEKNSGEITSDGIYTAPGREGVFEIRISCAELPLISTYAYAVVKKKNPDQQEE